MSSLRQQMHGECEIYKPWFWKDGVWALALLALILGLPFFIFGCVAIAYGIVAQGLVAKASFLFIAIPTVIPGWFFVYLFWVSHKSQVSFTAEHTIYRRPRYILLGFKETKVPNRDIRAAALGFVALSRIYPDLYPDAIKSRGARSVSRWLGIEFMYMKDNKTKTLKLPIFGNHPAYLAGIKKLIEDTKLQQTELKFVFKK